MPCRRSYLLVKSAGRRLVPVFRPPFVAGARRAVIDRHRRLRRAPSTEEIPDGLRPPPPHDKPVELCAVTAAAASAMGELLVEQKTVIQLAIYMGSPPGVAPKRECPRTVKTHLRRDSSTYGRARRRGNSRARGSSQ